MEKACYLGPFQFPFQWLEVLFTVNHLLVTIKSSFNFLIYFGACMARRSPKRGEWSLYQKEEKKGYGLINIARLERKDR